MDEPQYTFEHKRSVAFKDTDMAGVVHFTQLIAYVEEAEHAALFSVAVKPISSEGGFPKVHIDCDYESPVRFGDSVVVKLGIQTISQSSLTWIFEMITSSNKKVCAGSFVTVFVNKKGSAEALSDAMKAALDTLVII